MDTLVDVKPGRESSKNTTLDITPYKLSPTTDHEQIAQFVQKIEDPLKRQVFEMTRQNPLRLYEVNGKKFYGLWINLNPLNTVEEIGWDQTIMKIGNKEQVEQVLDMFAYSFTEADNVYDWRREAPGFSVVKSSGWGMEQGNIYGIRVSFSLAEYLAQALDKKNQEKAIHNIIANSAEFVHERTHGEYSALTLGGGPEAVSQGCQFLYAPGDNVVFEHSVRKTLEKAGSLLNGSNQESWNHYDLHNIVWISFLQNKFAKQFPEKFKPLEQNANTSISELNSFMPKVAALKTELGSTPWQHLRKDYMGKLINFDPQNQGAIIDDFKKKAPEYGLEKLVA